MRTSCLTVLALSSLAMGKLSLASLNLGGSNLVGEVSKDTNKVLAGDTSLGGNVDLNLAPVDRVINDVVRRDTSSLLAGNGKMIKLRKRRSLADPDRSTDHSDAVAKRASAARAEEKEALLNRRTMGKLRSVKRDHGAVAVDHLELARRSSAGLRSDDILSSLRALTKRDPRSLETVAQLAELIKRSPDLTLEQLLGHVNTIIGDTTTGANTAVYTTETTAGKDVKTVEDVVVGATNRKRSYTKAELFDSVNALLADTTGGVNTITYATEITVGTDTLTVEQALEELQEK